MKNKCNLAIDPLKVKTIRLLYVRCEHLRLVWALHKNTAFRVKYYVKKPRFTCDHQVSDFTVDTDQQYRQNRQVRV